MTSGLQIVGDRPQQAGHLVPVRRVRVAAVLQSVVEVIQDFDDILNHNCHLRGGATAHLRHFAGGVQGRALSTCAPRRDSTTSYSSRVPFVTSSPSGSTEEWRKAWEPSSAMTKPKPLSASNHFTRPVGMMSFLL